MKQHIYLFLVLLLLYSCSPINKQHGYLMDDLLISSDKISEFEPNITTRDEIFQAIDLGIIHSDDLIQALNTRCITGDVILTGTSISKDFLSMADQVTELRS